MWRCSALVLLAALAGCERYPSGGDLRIRSDMVNQPSFRPQENPRPLPEGSVPTQAATLRAPEDGQKLYGINCAHCHGASGRGDGPVSAKFVKPADLTVRRSDEQIYRAVRYGTPMMPPHAESLAEAERRQVVNYVRKLERP